MKNVIVGYEGWTKQWWTYDVETETFIESFPTREEAYNSFLPAENIKVIMIIYKAYWSMLPIKKSDEGLE